MSKQIVENKELQKVQLEILSKFVYVCEKHNLNFFLDSGTLLGAVRHSGFIPWDDDIDIGMLRDDYDLFLKCAQEELGGDFFLQTSNTDSGYLFSYAKLRKNNTSQIELFTKDWTMHHGIYIDVFPFDYAHESVLLQKIHHVLIYLITKLKISSKEKYSNNGKNVVREKLKWMLHLISKIVGLRSLHLVEQTILKLVPSKSNYVTNTFAHKTYRPVPIDWLTPFSNCEFEGTTYPAPRLQSEYLGFFYGNYMKIPEIKERQSHGLVFMSDSINYDEFIKKEVLCKR